MTNYWEESAPSISAVGEALIALEKEAEEMKAKAEQSYAQMVLHLEKQRICHEAIKAILTKANGGKYPEPMPYYRFPSLS